MATTPPAVDNETPASTPQRGYASIRWQLIILGIFRFSEALAWTTIFPYVFFMMQSFLPESPARDANAAALSTLTVALFTFGEFLTSMIWAKISDRFGRKPTLIIGVLGGSISTLIFGISTSLWIALAARAFGGLVNPNVGVISACVGELVKKKEHQGKAFSIVPFLRGLGSLVGPVIGGHLANPVVNLPTIFHRGSLWETYPYLLPNLIVMLFIVTSGVLGFLFLEESHPNHQNRRDCGRHVTQWALRNARALFGPIDSGQYDTLANDESGIPLSSTSYGKTTDLFQEGSDEVETSSSNPSTLVAVPPAYSIQVILQISSLSLLAFHKVSSDVIIPIFLANPSASEQTKRDILKFRVGFSMTSPSISNVQLTQAVVAIISQILIVPKVVDRFGPLRTFRWAMFMFPWLYCLTPFTARLPCPTSIIAILLDLWAKCILVSLGYVASAILLTNTTPSPIHLATVNGAAASLGCLARSIGAAVSGSMFHVGLTSGYIGVPFWTLSMVAAMGAVLSWFLRDRP